MKTTIFFILFFFSSSLSAQITDSVLRIPPDSILITARNSQPVTSAIRGEIYHVNPWVTGGIIVAGTIAGFAATPIIGHKDIISQAEIQALNRNIINGIDSWALHQNSTNLKQLEGYSGIAMLFSAVVPLTLGFDSHIREDWLKLLAMYLEMHAINGMLYFDTPLGPLFQNKYRPIVYHEELPYDQRKSGNLRNSFYSGHTAFSAGATFFMAKVYCDYHPDLGADKFFIYAAAAIPPLALGYFRLRALDHFPSDILTGLGVGIITGFFVPEVHRISDQSLTMGFYSSPDETGFRIQLALK